VTALESEINQLRQQIGELETTLAQARYFTQKVLFFELIAPDYYSIVKCIIVTFHYPNFWQCGFSTKRFAFKEIQQKFISK